MLILSSSVYRLSACMSACAIRRVLWSVLDALTSWEESPAALFSSLRIEDGEKKRRNVLVSEVTSSSRVC